MSDLPYTNREIDRIHTEIMDTLTQHTKVHAEILAQVKYTNGRVRLLEKLVWMGLGGLSVITFIISTNILHL